MWINEKKLAELSVIHPLRSINVQKFQGNPFLHYKGISFRNHWTPLKSFVSTEQTVKKQRGCFVLLFSSFTFSNTAQQWTQAGPGVGVLPLCVATTCEVFCFVVIIRNMLI